MAAEKDLAHMTYTKTSHDCTHTKSALGPLGHVCPGDRADSAQDGGSEHTKQEYAMAGEMRNKAVHCPTSASGKQVTKLD